MSTTNRSWRSHFRAGKHWGPASVPGRAGDSVFWQPSDSPLGLARNAVRLHVLTASPRPLPQRSAS
eukprot:6696990-Lingulodinium_polyedra.AAC.1